MDLNPLAVELAKLSLWLTTIARQRPLSFLDHHLQIGDSLVGARLSEIGINGGAQFSLYDADSFVGSVGAAVGTVAAIESARIAAVSGVKQQEKSYADMHTAHTGQIILRETRLNEIVYTAFALTPDEIGLVEAATQYPYGEV